MASPFANQRKHSSAHIPIVPLKLDKCPIVLREFEFTAQHLINNRPQTGPPTEMAPQPPLKTYEKPQRAPPPRPPPPPWLVYAEGMATIDRLSTSSGSQFQGAARWRPRQRDSCTPTPTKVFVDPNEPMPTTAYKSQFPDRGYTPKKRESCRPDPGKSVAALVDWSQQPFVGAAVRDGLFRTTSADAFRGATLVRPRRREPFIPPWNKAPYSGEDDQGSSGNIFRTTSAETFRHALHIVPRKRESCRPDPGKSVAALVDWSKQPFVGAAVMSGLFRTTSGDAFLPKPYVKRKPYLPPADAGCPY